MSIEFRCTQCQKLLRTPDETVGRQAKCPECGNIMTIPAPATTPASAGEPFAGSGTASGPAPGSPFGQVQGAANETGNPYQSPGDYHDRPAGLAHGFAPVAPIQPTIIDMGDIFRRNWAIFKQQWGMCLAGWGVAFAVNVGIGFLAGGLAVAAEVVMKDWAGPLSVVLNIAQQIVSMWISIGLSLFTLRLARGQQAVFADLFAGGPYLLRILFGSLLYGLVGLVGLLLLIIPGVIWLLMFSQFYYLILDRNLSILKAFSVSRELTRGNKLTYWAILIIAWFLGLMLILCTCLVGALAVAPYWMLLLPVIYLTMSGQFPTAQSYAPQPQNYGALPQGYSPPPQM